MPNQNITTENAALTAGSLNADLIPATDVRKFRSAVLQIIGVFTGTLTFQGSNDGVTFFSINAINLGSGSTATPATVTATTTGIFLIPLACKFLRVRMTAYTSGTATGVVEYSTTTPDRAFVQAVVSWASSQFAQLITYSAVNGDSSTHLVSAATTNPTNVKVTAGQVWNLIATNTTATVKYVKLFNKASAPAVGTDTPFKTIAVPPTSSVALFPVYGLPFSLGIGFAITGAAPDLDTTAVAAGDVILDLEWR